MSRNNRLVIATDLDGTFLGGSQEARKALYGWITRHRAEVLLFFVTGRGVESVAPLLSDPEVPVPDYVIADVGASVARAPSLTPLSHIEARLREGWPGDAVVRERTAGIPGLEPQPVPMSGRVSFFRRSAEAEARATEIARELGLTVLLSKDDLYLDILPVGATKGAALLALLDDLGLPTERTLVCGDTLNDLSLFATGLSGVVVGDSEEALRVATSSMQSVFQATRPGAGGIADALSHFFEETVT